MIVSTYNNYSNCYVGHGDVVELLQQLLRLRRRLPDVVKYDVVVLMQLMEGPQECSRVIVVVAVAAAAVVDDGEVAAVANEVDAVVFDVGGEAKTFH